MYAVGSSADWKLQYLHDFVGFLIGGRVQGYNMRF